MVRKATSYTVERPQPSAVTYVTYVRVEGDIVFGYFSVAERENFSKLSSDTGLQ